MLLFSYLRYATFEFGALVLFFVCQPLLWYDCRSLFSLSLFFSADSSVAVLLALVSSLVVVVMSFCAIVLLFRRVGVEDVSDDAVAFAVVAAV